MSDVKKLTVNGIEVEFTTERNILEVVRKAGINIPTFCYKSELSIFGACRMCVCEVSTPAKGRDGSITYRTMPMAACSTAPEDGMIVKTDTAELRKMRKIAVELLLANHNVDCPNCVRSADCELQDVARRLGVTEVRYSQKKEFEPIDDSSPSIVRDPNKCILCGDCVRVCRELLNMCADLRREGVLEKVTCPALIAQAQDDNMADPQSCHQIMARIASANKVLYNPVTGGHNLTFNEGRWDLMKAIVAFLKP